MNNHNEVTPKANISSPANQSLQQSLYIAALDRHLGIRGLVYPVTDTENQLEYDFYHPKTGNLVKVFQALNAQDIVRYETARTEDNNVYIIVADDLPQVPCDSSGEPHSPLDQKEITDAVTVLGALLYMDDKLWEYNTALKGWEVITPVAITRCLDAIYDCADSIYDRADE